MKNEEKSTEEMRRIIFTMTNAVVIVASVLVLIKLSKEMIGDLKDMGL